MERFEKFNELEVIEDVSEIDIQKERNISSVENLNKENVKAYMKTNQLIEHDESDLKVQLVTNNVKNEKYYRLTGNGARIEIVQDTGELRSYINSKPTAYISGTTYNLKEAESVAKEIMKNNELLQVNQNYEFVEIIEKTNYYPTAWFNDNINSKSMFIIFNPIGGEIIAIGTKNIPMSENNEIKISEEKAKNVAKNMLNKTEEEILTVEQIEVIPNQMFLESGYYYSDLNIKRNAYVITFDTICKLKVFVDATTGEVIGGDGIW